MVSTDVFANIINTYKCLEELKDRREQTKDILNLAIENIDRLNNMFDFYEEFNYRERKTLKREMKEQGKIFLEQSYRLFNILHRIEELKKRVGKFLICESQ